MEKKLFTLSDGEEQYEGYTDGTLWNGWSNVFFTRDQLQVFVNSTPYDLRFFEANTKENDRDHPVAIIYFEDEELIESSPIAVNGEYVEGYSLNGFEFMEVES